MIELTNGWMHGLKNAYHFSVVHQINETAGAFESESVPFIQASSEVSTAYTGEDVAYKKLQKDWNVETLKDEDKKLDTYMIALRKILDGFSSLPDGESLKQPAKELLQMWKEFDYSTSDGYAAGASKVLNMVQIVMKHEADATALGVKDYFLKARKQAYSVLQLVSGRTDERSQRIVGELKAARAKSDAAIKQLYMVINSLQVLTPSDDITTLAKKLKAIEDYARQYYMSKGGSGDDSADGGDQPDGGEDGGSDVTPVVPETPAEQGA